MIGECPCEICDGGDSDLAGTVREHGWSVLRIFGGVDFAYTVGLWHTFRRPEVVMFGLGGDHMPIWLNTLVNGARDHGWPADDEPFPGVLDGFPTMLREVHDSWHRPLFGTSIRFYRDTAVPFQQLVWPDRNGVWPWSDDATASSRNRQARTWLPVDEHPPGGWRLVGELEPHFPFPVGPDVWALTTPGVASGADPVSRVIRDGGVYDILDARGHAADDLGLTFLGTLFQQHPHLAACADLPDGETAQYDPAGRWTRTPLPRRDRRASSKAWKRAQPITSADGPQSRS